MKEVKISIQTTKEILIHIKNRYKDARHHDKNKILDEFVATTSYGRKYAITLLNQPELWIRSRKKEVENYTFS